MKKIVAVLLCFATIFSMLGIFASAQDEETQEETTVIEGADFVMYDEEDDIISRLLNKPFYIVGTPSYFLNLFIAFGLAVLSLPMSILGLVAGFIVPPILAVGFVSVPLAFSNLALAFVGIPGAEAFDAVETFFYELGQIGK